jgi:hypothetical protein
MGPSGQGTRHLGKDLQNRVGKDPLAAGAGSHLQRLPERGELTEGRESQMGLAHESG